ncbi:hypothetical protein [Mesorhizobium sp. CO1-1-9]|uniref:hypothetical protein n=1 Tax=Mesorhizobium sp. CO1-1-9 TaxID=2876630 RepID=UPI001CCBBC99|nr:hypothetical protein [Mesorhizobium sp. CO1-1-9]MBZ9693920.1 hypothetical protein [Mesorhizobium sp. CO1-1-9]
MPRAGGVYSAPPGTAGSPNTTIESAKYNALVADLVTDANAARPVTAGGMGATTAVGGNDNLNAAGANMASAATVNLANATGAALTITGTVTITSFGVVAAGAERVLTFAAILTLTYNATSMILPGAANIVTAAGDVATMRSLGGGNWQCISYQRATTAPFNNVLTQPALTLEQSAAPVPTAEGRIQWDTDDNVIVVGDGAATQIFAPLPASAVAGDLLYLSASKVLTRLAKGTAAQVLNMNPGATAPAWGDRVTLGTPVSASGVAVDFTGIPATAKCITVSLSGISTNGTSPVMLQMGTAGGIENTGYNGSVGAIGGTAASLVLSDGLRFSPIATAAADSVHGVAVFNLIEAASNTWSMSWVGSVSNSNFASTAGGSKVLAGTLDRIRLTTQGGVNAFDAGKINILYC